MNIELVKQAMLKEAAMPGKGAKLLIKLFPHAARRATRGFNFSGVGPAARGIGQMTGAVAKDIPGVAWAGIKGTSKGGWTATKFLANWLSGGKSKLGVKPIAKRIGTGIGRVAAIDLLASAFSPEWRNTQLNAVSSWLGPAKAKATDVARDAAKKTKEFFNDTQSGVGTRVIAGPQGSVGSLFNPASGLTGGVDWVPQGYIDFVQKYIPGDAGKTTAHLTMKGGAMALLAAGLVGGYRAARHIGDLRSIDKADRPSKDMASELSTTFEGNLSGEEKKQKKAASETPGPYDIASPGNFTTQNLTATALPVGTFLLAAGLTYKGVDTLFDKLRNKRLDKAIAEKEQAVKRLIAARAQVAKGAQSMDAAEAAVAPISDNQIYTKAASQEKAAVIPETVQLFGALSAAVILASAIGSYAYTSASDEDNLKYKAYKKALKEYAKAKTGMTPITMAPSDSSEYFASIDAAKQQGVNTPRNQPTYDADALNKPISVSF